MLMDSLALRESLEIMVVKETLAPRALLDQLVVLDLRYDIKHSKTQFMIQ